jgi:SHS2 domain-containing protein
MALKAVKSKFASKFKFLEKAVTADVAFEAYGKSLKEVFENAALATAETMVGTAAVATRMQKIIKLQNKDLNALLIDFLNEIVYYKDAEQILLVKFDVDIKENKETGVHVLTAKIAGEPIDYKKHQLRADVKAATYHMFELKQHGKTWTARVVLDI